MVKCSQATVAALIEKNAKVDVLNAKNDDVLTAAIKLGKEQVIDAFIKFKGLRLVK